jgi:uncharacterized protein involved in exopolysaccharide biosynthesis
MSNNSKTASPSPSIDYYDDEIDLRDLIFVLWRYRKFILGIFLASLLIGVVISFMSTPVYQVQAKISLGNYAADPDSSEPEISPETAREILLSSDFQKEAWGAGTNAGGVNVTLIEKTNILQITLETSESQQGEVLLNELIAHFNERTDDQYERSIELLNDAFQRTEGELQDIEKNIDQARELLENTSTSQIQQARLLDTLSRFLEQRDKLLEKKLQSKQKLIRIEHMEVLEKPKAPSSPVRPRKKLNITVAGILGLMVGGFAAFTVDYFKRNPLKAD